MTKPSTATEAVARFLQMNYRGTKPGGPWPSWEEASQDERDAWLCEASYIVRLVRSADEQ